MIPVDIIFQHFPELSEEQKAQFTALNELYRFHNERVNVISRKDIDNLYVHHVLHSLALAKACKFEAGKHYLDIGTGGGFPGIPLAIMYPQSQFTLADSIGKKINVVNEVIANLELKNALGVQIRVEQLPVKVDGIVARAVAPAIELWNWSSALFKRKPLFYLLKGGDLTDEINQVLDIAPKTYVRMQAIQEIFPEYDFFETKKVLILGDPDNN